jgi:hypothetical protein
MKHILLILVLCLAHTAFSAIIISNVTFSDPIQPVPVVTTPQDPALGGETGTLVPNAPTDSGNTQTPQGKTTSIQKLERKARLERLALKLGSPLSPLKKGHSPKATAQRKTHRLLPDTITSATRITAREWASNNSTRPS